MPFTMRLAVPSRGSTVRLTRPSGFPRWIMAALLLVVAFSVAPLLLVGHHSQVGQRAACLGPLFLFFGSIFLFSLGSSPGCTANMFALLPSQRPPSPCNMNTPQSFFTFLPTLSS